MPHYGKLALVGNFVLETELVHIRFSDLDDILKRPFVGLGWDGADIPLDELFAEDVIPVPIARPSGRRDISSLFGMLRLQVESILGREQYEDDDGEWTGKFVEDLLPVKSKWRRW